MLSQTELDNYKLRVELLHEKLRRSEEHRKQLEDKFEKLMKKRNEEERTIKNKRKFVYQQFLEELRERNERNKALVKMLERIDQQAAALAAKSERLKMTKLQYELYFAKLLQAQATQSIQETARGYAMVPLPQHHHQYLPPSNLSTPLTSTTGVIYQTEPTNNVNRNLTSSLGESWGMMPSNLASTHTDESYGYRLPPHMDYSRRQLPFNQEPLPTTRQPIRQINLKSNAAENSIILQQSYPTVQVDALDGTERNQNDYKYYLNSPELYTLPSENLIKTPSPLQGESKSPQIKIESKYQTNDFQKVDQKNDEKRDIDDFRNDKITKTKSDKLQFSVRENFPTEITKNYNGEYTTDNTLKNSQSINIARDNLLNDELLDIPKQKIDKNFDKKTTRIRQKEDILGDEKELSNSENWIPLKNANERFERPSPRQPPTLWNFDGKISTNISSPDLPIKLGKKEKLSIESIENVIYGEKISPIDSEKLYFMDKNEINEPILENNDLNESENMFKFDNYEKDIDTLEKDDGINEQEKEKEIISIDSGKSAFPVDTLKTTKNIEEERQKQETEDNKEEKLDDVSEKSINEPYTEAYVQDFDQFSYNEPEIPKKSYEQFDDENQSSYGETKIPKESYKPVVEQFDDENQSSYGETKIPKESYEPVVEQFDDDNQSSYGETKISKESYEPVVKQFDDENQSSYSETKMPKESYEPVVEQFDDQTLPKSLDIEKSNNEKDEQYLEEQYQNQDFQYQPEVDYQNQVYSQDYQGQDQNYQGEGYEYDSSAYQYNYGQQEGEYPTQYDDMQYTSESQYPTEEQYNTDGQYTTEGIYQNSDQQQYPDTVYDEQNYNDQGYQQTYEGSEYQQYQNEGLTDFQGKEEYPQQYDPQVQPVTAEVEEELLQPTSEIKSKITEKVPEGNEASSSITSLQAPSPLPPSQTIASATKPASILAVEKSNEQQNAPKKKKRVNFLDSETEDSSSAQKVEPASGKSDESDFDFSSK